MRPPPINQASPQPHEGVLMATQEPESGRAMFLPLLLGGMLLAFFALFLILITGGFFFHVLSVMLFIAFLAGVHYLLWGKSLMQQTAGEREELEVAQRAREEQAEDWHYRR